MTARLPTPGGDDGQWGQVLNTFLGVEHNPDGTLLIRTDGTLNGFYTKPGGGIPESDLSGAVQTILNSAGDATSIQGVTVNNTSPGDGEVLQYSASSTAWVPATVTGSGSVPDATTSAKGIVQLAGDLAGTASSPSVTKIHGVTVSGTPSNGQVIVASSGSAAAWSAPPSAPVTSVAGKVGVVTLAAGDIASGTLTVAQGGIGVGTLSAGALLVGNGTSAVTTLAAPAGNLVGDTASQTLTNKTIIANSNNVTANGLRTASGTVSVSAAAAPSAGNVLTATNGTTATWQAPSTGSGYIYRFVPVSANYTAVSLDVVLVDSTSGGVTVTLPPVVANSVVRVKHVAGTNGVQVASPTGEFDGSFSGTDTLTNAYAAQEYLSNGTEWYRV